MNTKPRLLDRFCGAGGAARGYQLAGFYVVGVDNRPQPRYAGDEFHQGDALDEDFIAALGPFDAQHASPPCQAYSSTRNIWNNPGGHPQLVEQTRERLRVSGVPWVMENVVGAPIAAHIILCGTMFGLGAEEYELRRHRLFETSALFMLTPPCQHRGPVLGVYGGHARDRRREGRYGSKGPSLGVAAARKAMGIDWMTADEISEAIPPAYTEYLGHQLQDLFAGAAA